MSATNASISVWLMNSKSGYAAHIISALMTKSRRARRARLDILGGIRRARHALRRKSRAYPLYRQGLVDFRLAYEFKRLVAAHIISALIAKSRRARRARLDIRGGIRRARREEENSGFIGKVWSMSAISINFRWTYEF